MAGMTDDPFEACWYRWERAESRHQEMVKVWNDYVARDPHHVELVHQGQRVHLIRVVESEPIPPDFAGLFGEWLYNLRACLDYIIWAAAAYASGTLPPANEGVLQYPIYDDEAAWTRNLYRIRGLPEHQQQRLREMQPFAKYRRQTRPACGRPWKRRRCASTVVTVHTHRPNSTHARPLYVRGDRNITFYSAAR
jgi:hypothetical protein